MSLPLRILVAWAVDNYGSLRLLNAQGEAVTVPLENRTPLP